MKGTWILECCVSDRFPYRLQVFRGDKPWLVLRTQDRWPAAGRHIFCLREDEPPSPDDMLEEFERWREQSRYGVSFPPQLINTTCADYVLTIRCDVYILKSDM
jgi:hypothetical protein